MEYIIIDYSEILNFLKLYIYSVKRLSDRWLHICILPVYQLICNKKMQHSC